VKVFVQDPQVQLGELGLSIPDLVDPRRPAVLDAEHRSFVNYETFFFADEADRRRFDADPSASCGWLTDPISKERFRPVADSPRLTFNGRAFYFMTEANKALFEKTPEAFALPNYDRIEIPGMR
jgi:YHS domain-containing protein